MELEKALQIVKQGLAAIQTNLETHQQIQTAIQTIEDQLNKKSEQKVDSGFSTKKE